MQTPHFFSAHASIKKAFVLCATAVVIAAALDKASAVEPAQTPTLYNVEIVVFRTTSPLGAAEDWNTESAVKEPAPSQDDAPGETAAAATAAPERLSFQPLSSAQFKLAGTDAALRRSAGYEVLAHVGWTQPAAGFGSNSGIALSSLGVGDQTLRGRVGLEQGRYLHVNLDLAWTPANPPTSLLGASTHQGPVTFTLKQKRRVRPFEQNYFDHPAFGVIAIVTPAS